MGQAENVLCDPPLDHVVQPMHVFVVREEDDGKIVIRETRNQCSESWIVATMFDGLATLVCVPPLAASVDLRALRRD